MSVLGEAEPKIRYSLSAHLISRWRLRIKPHASTKEISEAIKEISQKGTRYEVEEPNHYRMCYDGICVLFFELSPLHSLAKTVYKKTEEDLISIST